MNSGHLCNAIHRGLSSRRLRHDDVKTIALDGCSVNIAVHNEIEYSQKVRWYRNLCLSHCTNNGGELATFPALSTMWTLLQKVFAGDNSKIIWQKETNSAWLTYSDTRWFSKYDVYEDLFNHFGDLRAVLENVIKKKYSPANTGKLLLLVTDEGTKWYATIELSAYVECLYMLRNFCYRMEADGDIVFDCGESIDALFISFPDGSLPKMPSTERLITGAVTWANGLGLAPLGVLQRRTVAEVRANVVRPRRAAAVAAVRAATFAGETAAQRVQRERSEQVEAVEVARRMDQYAQDQEDAVAAEAAEQAKRPPLTREEWFVHIKSGIQPSIDYVLSRFSQGGDRFQQVELYRAARLFDPVYAKQLTTGEAESLIDKLRHYPPLDSQVIIAQLKATWRHYRARAFLVNAKKVDVVQWHYDFYLELQYSSTEKLDLSADCNFCSRVVATGLLCNCIKSMMIWWEVTSLLALILPSSGSSERVFSLLKHFWSDQQTTALSDVIRASLYLAVNKRKL